MWSLSMNPWVNAIEAQRSVFRYWEAYFSAQKNVTQVVIHPERTCPSLAAFATGSASADYLIDDASVQLFASASRDCNPIHLDEAYAQTTRFKGRIAHGMLVGSLISALFAEKIPGAVYVSQTLSFVGPVRIGTTVTVKASVIAVHEKGRARFACICSVGERVVITGEALLLVP